LKKVKWFLPVLFLAAFLVMPLSAFAASPSNARVAKVAHPRAVSSKQFSSASSCPQIPANTDVMKLSDKELATFGLPSHASLQANPTLWQYVIKGSHRHASRHAHLAFIGIAPFHILRKVQ